MNNRNALRVECWFYGIHRLKIGNVFSAVSKFIIVIIIIPFAQSNFQKRLARDAIPNESNKFTQLISPYRVSIIYHSEAGVSVDLLDVSI